LRESFSGINLPFGKRDVIATASVNQKDSHLAVDDAPTHGSSG